MASRKAAGEDKTGDVPSGYGEDFVKPRTQLEAILRRPLKIPCNAPHHHPWITRHEVDVRYPGRFISES